MRGSTAHSDYPKVPLTRFASQIDLSRRRGEVKEEFASLAGIKKLRLVRKPQAPCGLQRMRVKGADFGNSAHIERHHHPVAGRGGRDDLRALRQNGRDLGRVGASLRLEKTVADGDQHGRNRNGCGKARNQHQAPHPRD